MNAWPAPDLLRIRPADDLHVAPLRPDGRTPGTPTWVWSVVVDDALFVRAYHGTRSRWYQAALARPHGRIHIADMDCDVTFTPVEDPARLDRIDAAYRAKYADSPYLPPMVSDRSRAATLQISPRHPASPGPATSL